ncbi:MAG: pyridoxamine 5'-phosphate oxidase family protein [Alphaproteobacteria bacterium]
MSRLYGDEHRAFQDRFGSRKLADRLEQTILRDHVNGRDAAWIESRDFFFLSTVDHQGRPTVSHKGGGVGLVKVVDEHTLAFPSYDGNGMYFSMGNIAGTPAVGMLFIDFESPHRLRVQGEATIDLDDPLLANWPGADLVARVKVTELFVNCPRYIHRYRRVAASKYVPDAAGEAPAPAWKRVDGLQDALRDRDVGNIEGETIDRRAYQDLLDKGDG